MAQIPIVDLKAQYLEIQAEVNAAIARVHERGSFILGAEVTAFEREFAAYCNVPFAVGVASGTDALWLALAACGVASGDEVIVCSHTAVGTIVAIEMTGATPMFVDIDLERYTLDPQRVQEAISPRTRAILPVHLYGCPADLNPILELARENNLRVVEDCAQAHGARYAGQTVGGWGDISAFSFYPTKNLGAHGDGGAVLTRDSLLAERVRALREYGWRERYVSEVKGFNSRLDELQAAILRVKLKRLDFWNARRRALAALYSQTLSGAELHLPFCPPDSEHVFHQYVVRHPNRDEICAFLGERNIQTLIHYPVPVHLQPAYRGTAPRLNDLSQTELAAKQVLSLPIYPEMTEAAVLKVCEALRDYFAR
ncbi:MAG: DegT/DnrJ/EryC1/StrS family aminotransferase [Anaerolineales bacterium]|nr:DegT/DnrJ/EryC1/StrS family aminotransferase [Anaerolineales bacterium]